jgi:hypothetical protein
LLLLLLLQAGVHSGDSACTIPTQTIPTSTLNTIRDWTHKVAEALEVVGLINIQYAIQVRPYTRRTWCLSHGGSRVLYTLSRCTRLCVRNVQGDVGPLPCSSNVTRSSAMQISPIVGNATVTVTLLMLQHLNAVTV